MSESHFHALETEEREGPFWDADIGIYVGGLPENAQVDHMIQENNGYLRVFGYGSLCWNPGSEGALANASVKLTLGRARGYRRCWAQKSTDHRGNPLFPGIVCTLLKDEEFRIFRRPLSEEESLTEGVIYLVPPELVQECLSELDFREKGGYARDVIQVIEDETGESVQALLYRGTPDNPAFWKRALLDLPFASAVMSVAVGPSGENSVYLNRLDKFLESAATPGTLEKFDDTFAITSMANQLSNYQLFFLLGCGSNQHNQLLLKSDSNAANLVNNGEEAHELTEIALCVPKSSEGQAAKVFAGGGHSGLLTKDGRLFLFGWNEKNALGTSGFVQDKVSPLPVVSELEGLRVKDASLGFLHTVVIERDTGRLFAFGDNSRGQVDGTKDGNEVCTPTTPSFLQDEKVVHASAGLFHTAMVSERGHLITFGCQKFRQSLEPVDTTAFGRWKPKDGSRVVQVACGRRHTVVLDEQGRLWSIGDNKYGQLGRVTPIDDASDDGTPQLVPIPDNLQCASVDCGWSHTIALAKGSDGHLVAFGWGRNDKGQLGTGDNDAVELPRRLFEGQEVQSIACGAESTVVLDAQDNIWACGWNEHGNLATGDTEDRFELTKVKGAPLVLTPGYPIESRISIAAGGSHILAMKVAN